jgi:two-component system response regulator AtoC
MPVARNGRTILLAEDDLEVSNYLETVLICQGYAVEVVRNGEEVLAYLQNHQAPVSAVVLDVIMPRLDGLEALREIRRTNRDLAVIMMSGAPSPLNIVEAMKNGASDFLAKPINPDDLRQALKTAMDSKFPPQVCPPEKTAQAAGNPAFISASSKMRELQNLVASVGWSEAPVLIQGETGAGKEVLARQLHACSPRAKKAILKLNCAALPSELIESELFGYERGAFTGAFQRKPGMFELADGGTILLDEIGDMDFKLQAKLLQVLQDHEFQRLGGKDTIRVDVRVIAATHRDLEQAITQRDFREDLYYRLNVIGIQVPPLRERQEDVLALADFFVRKHSDPGAAAVAIPPALQAVFLEYHWPGNVRELENVVRQFLVLRDARLVEQDLRRKLARKNANGPVPVETAAAAEPSQMAARAACASAGNSTNGRPGGPTELAPPVLVRVAKAKQEAERSAILAALRNTNWNRREASSQLQIDYKALLYKMKVLAITKTDTLMTAAG